MSKTKGNLVLKALRKAGLASSSTLTNPEPEAIQDALEDLDDMMAEWDNDTIRIGYMFSDPDIGPLPDDDSGIPDWCVNGVSLNLAKRILIDNLRPVPLPLAQAAKKSYESIVFGVFQVPEFNYGTTLPLGAGNDRCYDYPKYFPDNETELETRDGDNILE